MLCLSKAMVVKVKNPMLCICSIYLIVAFAIVLLHDKFQSHILMLSITAIAAILCVLGITLFRKSSAVAVCGIAVMMTAVLVFSYINGVVSPTMALCGHYKTICGTVLSKDRTKNGYFEYELNVYELDDIKTDLKVSYYGNTDFCDVDDRMIFSGELERFERDDITGFETEMYYRAKGIFLRLDKEYGDDNTAVIKAEKHTWRNIIQQMRDYLSNSVESVSGDASDIASAIMLGNKKGLTFAQQESFRRAGLSHIFAISGMHLTFLSTMVYGVLSKIMKQKQIAALINMAVIVLFMAVTGFSAAIMRAGIMTLLFYGAKLFGTQADSKTSLLLSAFAICLINPFAVMDISLQLSFFATLGILVFYMPIYNALMCFSPKNIILNKLLSYICAATAMTAAASIGVFPVTAIAFESVQTLSVISNLLTGWAVTIFFFAEIVLLFVGGVPYISDAGRWIIEMLAKYMTACANMISQVPFASVYVPIELIFIILSIGAVCIVLHIILKKREKSLPKLIPIASFMVVLIAYSAFSGLYSPKSENMLEITALNVGQGSCIIAMKDGKAGMIDCGSEGDNAAQRAIEFLQKKGVTALEFIAVTHYHKDHINGVGNVMEMVKVEKLILPPIDDADGDRQALVKTAEMKGTQVVSVQSDLKLSVFNGASLYAFTDFFGENPDDEQSMAIMLDYNESEFLTTGDMSSKEEKTLSRYGDLLDCDVFMAGHHGSKNSNCDRLLLQITPQLVIASAGKNNSYGHPTSEAVARFDWIGARFLRTDRDGDVTVKTSGNSVFELVK